MPASAGSPDLLRHERFDGLFEAYHRQLLAYAVRRCRTLADAEDAVAEVFVVAWRRLDDVPDGDEALLWLYGVARRTVANSRRGWLRRQRLQARLEATSATPVASFPDADEGGAVLEALSRLSPADQELLRLVAWEELSHAEIARVMNISTNAVTIRVHRSRARLAEAMVKGPGRWRTWSRVKGNLSRRPSRELKP